MAWYEDPPSPLNLIYPNFSYACWRKLSSHQPNISVSQPILVQPKYNPT